MFFFMKDPNNKLSFFLTFINVILSSDKLFGLNNIYFLTIGSLNYEKYFLFTSDNFNFNLKSFCFNDYNLIYKNYVLIYDY